MKKGLLILAIFLVTSQAASYNVGTAPPQTDLGQVERGETYNIKFYLVASDINRPQTLEPVVGRPSRNVMENMDDVNYFEYSEYSAESVESWVGFDKDTYTVGPDGSGFEVAGREVNANVSFTLDVPRNAEPGYHAVKVKFEPVEQEGEGSSIQTIALTPYKLFFRVPGEAGKQLQLEDISAVRTGDDSVRVRADVENTGTVTTFLPPQELDVQSVQGPNGKIYIGGEYIAPGETKTIERGWSKLQREIDAGNYKVRGNLNYVSGSVFVDETFSITDFIQIRSSNQSSLSSLTGGDRANSSVPFFLIIMFLVIVGSVMYAFEIDPLLIILAMACMGAMSLIYFSGLPLYLAGIVLITTIGMFYYGWL